MICGTVSESRDGVEHKSSDLPRDEELSWALEAIFSPISGLLASAGMEEDHSHFCSVLRPSSISAQPRRTHVCCCYRAGLLGRELLDERGITDLGLIALGFPVKSCAATELGTLACLSPDFARSVSRETCRSLNDVATRLFKLRSLEQGSVCSSSQSCNEEKALG
jgi:hypothetical protein